MSGSSSIPLWLDNGTSLTQRTTNRPVDLGAAALSGVTTLGMSDTLTVSDTSARTAPLVSMTSGSTGTPVTTGGQSYHEFTLVGAAAGMTALQGQYHSTGLGAGEFAGATQGDLITAAASADNATSFMFSFVATVDDIGATNGKKYAYLAYPGSYAFDATLSANESDITIMPHTSDTGAGDSINTTATAATMPTAAGAYDGGGLVRTTGQGSTAWATGGSNGGNGGDIEDILGIGGTGDGGGVNGTQGEYYLKGSNETLVANYYNTVTPAGGKLTNLKFWGKDDAGATVQYMEFVSDTESTGDGTHDGAFGLDLAQGGSMENFLSIGTENDEGDIFSWYELANADNDYIEIFPGEGADDADATGLFIMFGADGGESTSGNGYKGGAMQITGGWGSGGYETGVNDGGDGNNLYLAGGAGGEGQNGGADGDDGHLVLGYDYDEGRLVGKVGIGTTTVPGLLTMGAGRFLESKGADVASANDLTLGEDGNYFDITGTTQINRISPTNWNAGSSFKVQFDGVVTIKDAQATGGGYNIILCDTSADIVTAAGTIVEFLYDGTSFKAWIVFSE